MVRLTIFTFTTFLLWVLAAGLARAAPYGYYGVDAARSLIERHRVAYKYPIGHPRVYDLPGYRKYRPTPDKEL
jgi:hypothetical protein